MRVVARFRGGGAVVVIDPEIVIVPAQDDVGRAVADHRLVLGAVGMDDGDHHIGAFLAQGRGLLLDGVDRARKFQVARARQDRGILVGRRRDADADAADLENVALAESGNERAVRVENIGDIEREFRLAHALEEQVLAEVEFVVAGDENVRRQHVRQRR